MPESPYLLRDLQPAKIIHACLALQPLALLRDRIDDPPHGAMCRVLCMQKWASRYSASV